MKRILGIFVMLFLFASLSVAQSSSKESKAAQIDFEEKVYDFGTIEQYSDATCEFTFKNTGKSPLVITKVITSCGCTVPDYPKSPIMPNQEGQIQVTYDSGKVGSINNQIVVRTNSEEGTVILKIKGKVVKKS
ncbi:MAG: DUF1573 domain-containing protein [Bacteroidales bacterium]|nr:DUF1573 domain-containing protein [Bacteroidales bacterium]